jgi:ABC-type branched-subunit amino acid transport system permease subunit
MLEFRWVIIPIFLIIVMMWKPFGLLARKESKFLGLGKGG